MRRTDVRSVEIPLEDGETRLLFVRRRPVAPLLGEVTAGDAPEERLYGLTALRGSDLRVTVDDRRFRTITTRVVGWLKETFGIHVPDLATMRSLFTHDVVIVNDGFSTVLSVFAKLLGKPIVYLDSLFRFPSRWWRRLFARVNLQLSTRTIAYSREQIELWSDELRVPGDRFTYMPFCMDADFYIGRAVGGESPGTYVFATGRDLGRDFGTLYRAIREANVPLKLVTLPYLLHEVQREDSLVQIEERVSYDRLFELYGGAGVVCVPLRKGIAYPAGIRAMLEGMLLGRPVVASRTPVLEEYAEHRKHVVFVEPEDAEALAARVRWVFSNQHEVAEMVERAREHVKREFPLERFEESFVELVEGLSERPQG